tara:strand:+ start:7068 stop:7961 length:894 start_codon:yes stop_codon:yes gene_type:complete
MKKILNMDVKPPEKKAFTIETDDDFIKLHTLTIASGKRGGGKSVAVANLIRMAKERDYFDKVFLITPTYGSNREIWNLAGIQSDDVFEPHRHVLRDIRKFIQDDKDEWDEFLSKKEKYKGYQKVVNSRNVNLDNKGLLKQLLLYEELGFFSHPPTWKYRNEVPPRLALILDDCMGTELLLPSAGLTKFVIAHRHHSEIGISVFMLVQSYCARESLTRAIREQTTNLMLFKVVQEQQLKKVYEESDLPISYKDFIKMATEVHKEPYCFLLMDFAPKDPSKRFRNCFNQYLPYKEVALT